MNPLFLSSLYLMNFSSLLTTYPVTDSSSSSSAPEYYTAAIFEHARLGNLSDPSNDIIRRNLNMYERATDTAASKGADIIVFPEYGIFAPYDRQPLKSFLEEIPDPRKVSSNPCEEKEEFLERPILYALSCMAKKNNIVVVADTGDIQNCTSQNDSKCPDDGVYHFNALVAFNRDGTLISRYHKVHLFYELGMDLPIEPQNSTFETDFGTFAMFLCFDYEFKYIVEAAKKVDNIIISSMWMDRMPLYNTIQYYQAWALGNNVTYLASNINIPGYGAVGSGIFSGHFGPIKYTYSPDGLSKLLVSRVPKSKHERGPFPNPDSSITVITENGTEEYNEEEDRADIPDKCSFKLLGTAEDARKNYRCLDESLTNYTLVKLTKLSDDLQLCSNGMCCHLNYSAASMNESYYFGVYNGTHNFFDRYFWCEENCLLVRCDPVDENECATFPTKSNTVFHRFEIQANFSTEYMYPSVMESSLRLAPMNEWSYYLKKEDESFKGHLRFESRIQEPILMTVFNGRCYERDPPYIR